MSPRWLPHLVLSLLLTGLTSANILKNNGLHPIVVGTWEVTKETDAAWEEMNSGGSALNAVEAGCTVCEFDKDHTSVGYGGHPDESGETTLDAMIMDGETHDVGAVGGLRRIKNAISVARKVMEHTKHTLLVGDWATDFAIAMGFPEEDLQTEESMKDYETWKDGTCQPNFWENVKPDPSKHCGPYKPVKKEDEGQSEPVDKKNHDTISMLAVDGTGKIAAATSTNGLNHKIAGRVGDSPIPGAGNYVDRAVGAAGATGDGDVMLRFLPSLVTVEGMKSGLSPTEAADASLSRIEEFYPDFSGAVIAVSKDGAYGAACRGMDSFPYSVRSLDTEESIIINVPCPAHVA